MKKKMVGTCFRCGQKFTRPAPVDGAVCECNGRKTVVELKPVGSR